MVLVSFGAFFISHFVHSPSSVFISLFFPPSASPLIFIFHTFLAIAGRCTKYKANVSLVHFQACLLELEEKEVCVDISPNPVPVQHIDHEAADASPVIANDTPVTTSALNVLLNEPIKDKTISAQMSSIDEDNEKSFTQTVVQKTIRVIRRTILQNGREISVEEQIEEEPTSGVSSLMVETELIPSKRCFRIPSPFGIVEEPNFQDDQQVLNDDNKGTVEITDITDEYDDREAASMGPSSDQFIEIHEVLDNLQVVEQQQSPEKIVELCSINDAHQSQLRTAFETLHEQEEEHDETTELNPVDIKTDANDEPIPHGQELLETERDLKDVCGESENKLTAEMVPEPQGEPVLEANVPKDLDIETIHHLPLGLEAQPIFEPELTSEFQKLDEITSELLTDAQQEPIVVCEEAAKQLVETRAEPDTECMTDQKIEHELPGEIQESQIEITTAITTEEQAAEVMNEDFIIGSDDETIGEPVLACEVQQQVAEDEPLIKVHEDEIFTEDEALIDHQEIQAVDPIKEGDGVAIEFERIHKSDECLIAQVEIPVVSSTELTHIHAEISCDEPQQLEMELSQQLQIPENLPEAESEPDSKVEMSTETEQIKASVEPDKLLKDELQSQRTSDETKEKACDKLRTLSSSVPSSTGDETESDVDNMDWNVSPDDERQFDEYFKEERPTSASTNSSTSTNTTRLESVSCEPVEDSDALALQGIDTVDSSRATPVQEDTTPFDMERVKENQPEEEVGSRTATDDHQEILDCKCTDTVEILVEAEDSSVLIEMDDALQNPVEEEKQTNDEDESVMQVLESDDVVGTEDKSTIEPVPCYSDEKMPIELAEQLSQQLVQEVFKSVETHPAIERLIQESLIQSELADPSSSSENDQESSSSQDEGGWWMVDPEDTKQEVNKPFEVVEEPIIPSTPTLEATESNNQDEEMAQQKLFEDDELSTTSESQLANVESLIVELEPDILQETVQILNLTNTESLSHVTVIRVGYGDEPHSENQQVAEPTLIDPLKMCEQDTQEEDVEEQRVISTLSAELVKDCEQDNPYKETEEQQVTGTAPTEPSKDREQDTLIEEVVEKQTSETEPLEDSEQDTLDNVADDQQVTGTPFVELLENVGQDTLDEEQQVATISSGDDVKVVEMGEKILEILPDIVEQLSNIETLIEDVENNDDPLERSQSQEEESTKERGDEWNTLTEHRESVAPTLGDNTTGPPVDDVQMMEQVARLVSDRVAMGQAAQQKELDVEWQEIQNLLDSRLSDQVRQSANSSTQTSSVRYLATVTQVTVHETVEERTVKLNDNLAALKTAVQRREVVVIQQIVITIVRTVTEWLETIEYRVCTIKQTKSMERRTEQIKSLSEEVRVVEESLNTLEEITEMAVEIVNEETKILLHKCVKSLKHHMQSVSEVTKRSGGEIEHIRRQWAEYLDQISNEEDRVKEVMHQLRMLQSTEKLTSQEKLVHLEDIETAVQERLEGVTQLLHSGHELVKETPFYQMPDSAYALLDTIKSIEETVRDERNVLLHKAALTAEYRQTLQEFAEIVRLSEALSASKLAARNPPEASQELEKRQRFLFCLSHFLQVLDTLEPHLDLDTRSLCQDVHAELVIQAGAILDRAVNRQEIVEMTLASWNLLEMQWAQEDDWFRQLQIPDISKVRSDMFADMTESIKVPKIVASFLNCSIYLIV